MTMKLYLYAHKETYIVYMGDLPEGDFSATSLHTSMMEQVVGGSKASESLLHSYQRSFNGFVAKMTEEEMNKMSSMEGVVSVFPNEQMKLHTTRSWDFLGLTDQQAPRAPAIESDIIVGMLDTGVWPESESFSDGGFGPPPSNWKGICQSPQNFTCNKKIIGARYYRSQGFFYPGEIPSPRDTEGHGTHTASTVAGREVYEASLVGLAAGTARGGVPSARIAVYKICWSNGCSSADILAAFDDAIADGVDIISLSVGGGPQNYFSDSIAIGAFHAMTKGILTSNSAGNSGPTAGTVTNVSPWSLTVAASTIDRRFVTNVELGNSEVYEGVSINTFTLSKRLYPLVYGGNVPNKTNPSLGSQSRYCISGSLDATLVKGKIVLCDQFGATEQYEAGAIGTIMQGGDYEDVVWSFPLSASYVDSSDGAAISLYINTTSEPMATIGKSITTKDESAPYVVWFSSRGPNPITLDILKPDLTAPGVDILAAWTGATSITGVPGDERFAPFNIISGTSMSCPHASGAAAYVKSLHPTWSPAAIKSALMTTATPTNTTQNTDTTQTALAEFAYGSGQIDPVQAANPGLVYDAGESDYVKFLCGQGYTTQLLQLVTGSSNTTCSASNNGTVWDLNYPSFSLSGPANVSVTRVFHRTVTNVGSPVSTYTSTVFPPPSMSVDVEPPVMKFTSLGQKQRFVLTVSGVAIADVMSGFLIWDDGVHQVRSPIVAHSLSCGQIIQCR
ncbi:cucumisin-like [Rhododendron vialii]|uniref:cucumisin-like n=1 Tax=Rhododendron vialii TaxID=182163 RepID=UPI00265F800B|nr:cucumisin-like [Rhododendron vialii]